MKKLYLLSWALVLLCFSIHGQTIRIADNNINRPAGANVYATLQAALDAAAPGDIVYIQPSPVQYGNVTVGRRVTLMGAGFVDLGDKYSSVGQITIVPTLDGLNTIAGSVFKDFYFTDFVLNPDAVANLKHENILIENVKGNTITNSTAVNEIKNLIVRKSVLGAVYIRFQNSDVKIVNNVFTNYPYTIVDLANSVNPLISNNIFYVNSSGGYPCISIGTTSTGVRIEHNVFSGKNNGFGYLKNAIVNNNIFYGVNPATHYAGNEFKDNTFSNNLVAPAYTMPPLGNGGGSNNGQDNLVGVSANFVNGPVGATAWDSNYDYTLNAGSPCLGAASTGDNIGPSGGLYPLVKNVALKPSAIPIITLFNNSGMVIQNQPLKTNIKAKSN
jgi:hypothetical protein